MVGAASLSAGQTSSNRRMAHLLSEQSESLLLCICAPPAAHTLADSIVRADPFSSFRLAERRESINSGFEDLRQAVPSCRDGQESKASLLRKAVQYIRELEARCATQTVKREEDINWTGPGGRHTPSDTRQRTESDSDEPLSGSRPRQRPAGQASESSRSAVKEEEMEEDDEEERRGDSSAMVDDDQVHQDSRMQLSMQMQIDSAKMRSPPPTATFPSLDHHSRQGAFARSPISSGAGQRHEFGFPRRSRVCPVPFCDEADDEAEVEVEAEARSYGSRFHQAQAASGWSRRAKPASSPGTLISPPDSGIKANFDHPMPSPAFSAPPPSPFFPIPNGGNNNHSHGHSHAQESDGNGNGNGNGDGNGDAHMQLSISTLTAPSLTHAPAALSARSTSSRAPSGTPRMGLESERSASIGPTAGNLRPSLVVGTPEMPKMLEAVPARP